MDNAIKLYQEGSVGVIAMEDRIHKNTFSDVFIDGLLKRLQDIKDNPEIKVVVIHGYDNYFCCGGTKEELITIQEGRAQFSDLQFFDLFLQCEIPVIAAMQGHAIGGGLVLGCYADIIILGEECIYNSNFMKYGFTPGMGGTYIIKKKFGEILGTEMLFSTRNYYGNDLKKRNAPVEIIPKKDVIKTAKTLAHEIADKPLLSLKLLKENLTEMMRSELPNVIDKELQMHKLSFAQSEVRNRIDEFYGN